MEVINNRSCAVCGDTPAKVHYGVLACFGCKGFFRRAVKHGRNKYVCRFDKSCEVTKYERNACRYCRFRKCLFVGMNPDFVRPDRENTKQKLSKKKSLSRVASHRFNDGDWTSLLSPNARKLMQDLSRLENDAQSAIIDAKTIANFSLKSLIADRMLCRHNKSSNIVAAPQQSQDDSGLLSIFKIVQVIDYIDGFLAILEEEHSKKFTIEDKSALISNTLINLIVFESIARYNAKGLNGYEEFKKCFQHFSITTTYIYSKLSDIFELFRLKPPSIIEYTVMKAYIVACGESTLLSNSLNESLTLARDNFSELLFKVIKLCRGKTSCSSSFYLSSFLHFIYESRTFSRNLRDQLKPFYSRDAKTNNSDDFNQILIDIMDPEVSDLLATMPACRNGIAETSHNYQFSPPSLSPKPSSYQVDYGQPCISNDQFSMQFADSSNDAQRPTQLQFPKVPLTMTKSIEDILMPPGMIDDPNIMNKPLSKDWADGIRLTPVFNKDIVSQFFPELSSHNF